MQDGHYRVFGSMHSCFIHLPHIHHKKKKLMKKKKNQLRNSAWIKFFFLEPVSRLWAYIFAYIFHSKASYWQVIDSLWFQGRIKKMVREIRKLLWYCQKEKLQYYMPKGFRDSCDRLSLKFEQCFADSLHEFAMQNLPICKLWETQYS